MNTTFKIIDAQPRLNEIFKGLFDKSDARVRSAVRHGISQAINAIKSKTKQNIRSSSFRSTSSLHYSTPLIEGVKAYLQRGGLLSGFVDILGDTATNDGTWRLRFFEGGTKIRKSKNGKSYGRIKGNWFFDRSVSSIGSDAITMIEHSVDNAIKEINNDTNN